jgi:transposase
MARPYSPDLRERVIDAVLGGMSRRRAADLFNVGIATVINWVREFRQTGRKSAKPMGGDQRSQLTGLMSQRGWILARLEAVPDLTIEELRYELMERGIVVGYGTIWRFFEREDITVKKNGSRRRARAA